MSFSFSVKDRIALLVLSRSVYYLDGPVEHAVVIVWLLPSRNTVTRHGVMYVRVAIFGIWHRPMDSHSTLSQSNQINLHLTRLWFTSWLLQMRFRQQLCMLHLCITFKRNLILDHLASNLEQVIQALCLSLRLFPGVTYGSHQLSRPTNISQCHLPQT